MNDTEKKYVNGLQGALGNLGAACQFGAEMAERGINRLIFVGCGAPHRVMASINYWVEKVATTVETALFYPAEFVAQQPKKIDASSMVFLISESGRTQEVLDAAKFIRDHYDSETVSISSLTDSALADFTDHHFSYGQSQVGFEAKFMVLLAIISNFLEKKGEWNLHTPILEGLERLPAALAQAENDTQAFNDRLANAYQNEDFFMVTASGPCYPVAYSLGVCIMMEALWVKMFEGEASEFFHGPFEIIDQTVPVILFIGEDPSRLIAERVYRFLQRYTSKMIVYDSINYRMEGIPHEVRQIFAPYILGAASFGLADALSRFRGQPLTTRRYMGKVDY